MTDLMPVNIPLNPWGWILIDKLGDEIVAKTIVVMGKVISTAFGYTRVEDAVFNNSIIQFHGRW